MNRRNLLKSSLLLVGIFDKNKFEHNKRPERYKTGQVWRTDYSYCVLINRDDTNMFEETWDTLSCNKWSAQWHTWIRWPKFTLDNAEYVGQIDDLLNIPTNWRA